MAKAALVKANGVVPLLADWTDESPTINKPRPGPPRMTLTSTMGSRDPAMYDIASAMRLMPGLELETRTLAPTAAAPSAMLMAPSSLSAWTYVRPSSGMRRAIHSRSSACGVIG